MSNIHKIHKEISGYTMTEQNTATIATQSPELAVQMKEGMRRLASGVSVVSAAHEGVRFAMTASSVTSVSDSPASLLVCVNKQARFSQPMHSGDHFCVSLLSAAQQDISNTCAMPNDEEVRFATGNWCKDETTGLFYLKDAQAAFICKKAQKIEHGTHDIFIGNIEKIHINSDDINPLIYLNGGYLG